MASENAFSGHHAAIANRAPLVIAIAAQVILVLAVLAIARHGDNQLRDQQRKILTANITDALKTERAYAVDTAIWTPFVAALDARPLDKTFLSDRLGFNLTTYSKAELITIIDSTGRPVWIQANGKEEDKAYLEKACPSCIAYAGTILARAALPGSGYADHILENALADRPELPANFPARAGATTMDDRAVVLASSVIAHEKPAMRTAAPVYALVYLMDLKGAFVDTMSKDLGIPGVSFTSTGIAGDGIPVLDEQTGATVGSLTWPVETPAQDLLAKLAPVGAAFMLVFTLLIAALSRWLRRASIDRHAGELLGNHMALHDPLTGLGNRAYLSTSLDTALAKGGDTSMCLLMMDLDGFKRVNDTHGHGVGDELIRQFAGRLSRGVPAGARTARLGGDEFAVLLTGQCTGSAEATGKTILDLAREPFQIDGIQAHIGCSIGVAFAAERGQQRTDLLRRADIALYVAKAAGRNRVEMYDVSMDIGLNQRHAMVENLRQALSAPDFFDVGFEPIFAIDGETPVQVGVEACLRIRQTAVSTGSIADMFNSAAELGMSMDLSILMLRLACQTAAPLGKMMLNVNVSPADVADTSFYECVMTVLTETKFPAHRLELELNDGLQIANSPPAILALKKLRAAGVRLSLDNFGAGYANVSQLRSLPIHRIKISSNLLRGLEGTQNAAAILAAMVTLGGSIGLAVGADGVESDDQLRILQGAGCVQAQGPHLDGRHERETPSGPQVTKAA